MSGQLIVVSLRPSWKNTMYFTHVFIFLCTTWLNRVFYTVWINLIVKNIFKSDTARNTAQSQRAICTQRSVLYLCIFTQKTNLPFYAYKYLLIFSSVSLDYRTSLARAFYCVFSLYFTLLPVQFSKKTLYAIIVL